MGSEMCIRDRFYLVTDLSLSGRWLGDEEQTMTFQWGNRWFKGARYALLGIALVLTVSCSSDRSMIDLKRFVLNMHKSTQPSVEPLPELAPIPAYTYAASSLPNPFSPEHVFPKPEPDPDPDPALVSEIHVLGKMDSAKKKPRTYRPGLVRALEAAPQMAALICAC